MSGIKQLTFDASDVSVSVKQHYMSVMVETEFADEVLENFEPSEIISQYDKLDELYEDLKEHYGDE
jgi:hypothetical protein